MIPFSIKVLYGSGDWGLSSIGMLRSIFYAIFLTDVVGLEPVLASYGALVGIFWDAINDPLIGMLSDRLHTRWGRRRPFLLFFAIPFGLSFVLLWSAPNWDNQLAKLIYVTLSFMLVDTLSTLVSVPFSSLTPELTPYYDERTTLSSYRSVFQLSAALTVVVAAPMIVDSVLAAGGTQQQGFITVGAIFGALGALPLLLIGVFIRERFSTVQSKLPRMRDSLRAAWKNVPFRYATVMHMLNWSAVDMVAVVFPYFLLYWMARGNLLAQVHLFGIDLALESAFFGVLMSVCILFVPFWLWMAQRKNKQNAYMIGMIFWIGIQLSVLALAPGELGSLMILAALAGIGVSAAYTLPDAIFADIIEWDELRTGRRQEGIYYGIRALIRKLAGAFVIFFTLQLLGRSGYQSPADGSIRVIQPEEALNMIRLLVSPISAAILSGTVILAWFFPLTRDKHARIQRLLAKRKERNDRPPV